MIQRIFNIVAYSLLWIGKKTRLTYNEINILVYYMLIPLSWTIILDLWLKVPYTSLALTFIWVGIFIATRHNFRQWCDRAFMDSVDFLNWFNRWGGNYVLNSVIICVVVPLVIYILLLWLVLK